MSQISVEEVLRQYLRRRIDLRAVRDWLASSQWGLSKPVRDLVDDVDNAIVYFDDGHIDESGFDRWISELLKDYNTRTGWLLANLANTTRASVVGSTHSDDILVRVEVSALA